jgi:predicted TIM-barrel fold metal-dependent hydrolase
MDYRVISADNHIIEAPGTFERLPSKFRDRTPRIMRGEDGGDGWSFDGLPPKMTFGLNALAGRPFEEYKSSGLRFEEILPGNYDGAAHLADMDVDDVDAAVVFPMATLAAYTFADREFALACIAAYNDWLLDEFCAVDPDRLVGLCMLPSDDGIDAACRELERVVAKGAKGMFLPAFPALPYYDEHYDPLWRAGADAGTPFCFHRTAGGSAPASRNAPQSWADLGGPGLNVSGMVQRDFSAIPRLSDFIFTGTFERFPGLKIVEGEVHCGWIPFWAQEMQNSFERQRHWAQLPIERSPTDYIGRNVFVTTLDDPVGFENLRLHETARDAVMFSTDYPHSVTLWPHAQKYIAELTAGMDTTTKHKVLAGNAARVFGLAA